MCVWCPVNPVSLSEVLVSAVAQLPRGPLLKRGSTVTLLCNVSVTTTGPAQVEVMWLRQPLPEPLVTRGDPASTPPPSAPEPPRPLAALTYQGVAQVFTNGSEVSVDRLSALTYRLRVHAAAAEDQGLYACRAEVWGQDPHGGWYHTQATDQSAPVTVYLYARGELWGRLEVVYRLISSC